MNKDEENGFIEDISEDVEDIGQDTDKILKHIQTQQTTQIESLKKIQEAIKASKQNKWWIIFLFLIDKCIMAGLIFWLGR